MSIEKRPIMPDRIRRINGSFAFIEHQFLRQGFFADLDHHQLLLYVFLVLAADRRGISWYSYDKICTLLRITADEYILARDTLIDRDLIAFDGYMFQVLSLPDSPRFSQSKPLRDREEFIRNDPATIDTILFERFGARKK